MNELAAPVAQRVIEDLRRDVQKDAIEVRAGVAEVRKVEGVVTAAQTEMALRQKEIADSLDGFRPEHQWQGTSLRLKGPEGFGPAVDLAGPSAYDMWLGEGNVGSPTDFLASLAPELAIDVIAEGLEPVLEQRAAKDLSNVDPEAGLQRLGLFNIAKRAGDALFASDVIDPDASADHSLALKSLVANTGKRIELKPNATYRTTEPLAVGAGSTLHSQGAKILIERNTDGTGSQLVVGAGATVEGLTLHLPEARLARRMIGVLTDGRLIDVTVSSDDQIEQGEDRQNYAVRLVGARAEARGLKVKRFDRSLQIYGDASDVIVADSDFWDYCKGVHFEGIGRLKLKSLRGMSVSANATMEPGQNFIGGGVAYGDLIMDDITGYGSGEHLVYLANDEEAEAEKLVIRGLRSFRSGQCALKARRWTHVDVSDAVVSDCAFGNATGSNDDALHFEYCDKVVVDNYSVRAIEKAKSCYNGAYFKNCDDVRIRANLDDCGSDAVYLENCGKVRGHVSGSNIAGAAVRTVGDSAGLDLRLSLDLDDVAGGVLKAENTVEPTKPIRIRYEGKVSGPVITSTIANVDVQRASPGFNAEEASAFFLAAAGALPELPAEFPAAGGAFLDGDGRIVIVPPQ